MVANDKQGRMPAFDTGPIPPSSLSKDEEVTIREINELLKQIQRMLKPSRDNTHERTYPLWASPQKGRTNNVILLDGERGVGKTSLLHTLIHGWSDPANQEWDKVDLGFDGMDAIVRTLPAIDFDPLPPDLPLYSWLVQAFGPLVSNLSRDSGIQFLEARNQEPTESTLAHVYRRLQEAAAVGWTTGLLKQRQGKDVDDFLLWQEQQQIYWQKLRHEWTVFLDMLFKCLEEAPSTGPAGKFPRDGLIVLPIDDLDLQVERTRELLLAIRVLRHERLIYILTGDTANADLAIEASFVREFVTDCHAMPEDILDKVGEHAKVLGRSLREKTTPSSQIFHFYGLPIEDAMNWKPPCHYGTEGRKNRSDHRIRDNESEAESESTFGRLLDHLWNNSTTEDGPVGNQETLSEFIRKREMLGDRCRIAFRKLQNFYDRWHQGQNQHGSSGIVEFLKLAIESPKEDELFVASQMEDQVIRFNGKPGICTAVPWRYQELELGTTPRYVIKWVESVEFVRRVSWEYPEQNDIIYNSASPQYLLALDLVSWRPSRFQISSNLGLTPVSLGPVWTEDREDDVVIPW